jgi:hypothetical protein
MFDDFFDDLAAARRERMDEKNYDLGFAAGEIAADDENAAQQYEAGYRDATGD